MALGGGPVGPVGGSGPGEVKAASRSGYGIYYYRIRYILFSPMPDLRAFLPSVDAGRLGRGATTLIPSPSRVGMTGFGLVASRYLRCPVRLPSRLASSVQLRTGTDQGNPTV